MIKLALFTRTRVGLHLLTTFALNPVKINPFRGEKNIELQERFLPAVK